MTTATSTKKPVTKTPTVLEGMTEVRKAAKFDKNVRVTSAKQLKDTPAIHQGDVYVVLLNKVTAKQLGVELTKDGKPKGWEIEATTNQLVDGDSTGSRHNVEGKNLKVFAAPLDPAPLLLGPCIVAKEGFRVTHPVHGHHDLPAGIYLTRMQEDARTKERVRD